VKVDLGIWSRLTQAVVVLVALAVLIFICLAYQKPIEQNERMRRDIDALRNDPATVTRLAREKLGYAKADETVIRFETNSAAAPK